MLLFLKLSAIEEANMKKCNRCGSENKDESNFCQNCGARLNNPETGFSSNKNLMERFRDANILIKLMIIIVGLFVLMVVSSWIGHIFFGIPLEPYTEGDSTSHLSEFDSLDIDGDGALSFYEVESLASDIPYDDLSDIFDGADKNDNGVLMGAEFDGYLFHVDKYYKELEKQQKAEQEKRSSSSSSSSSSKSVNYIDACPECGSEDIIEYVGPYGYTVYQCSACDYESYYEDDFVVEVSNSILPILESNLSLT